MVSSRSTPRSHHAGDGDDVGMQGSSGSEDEVELVPTPSASSSSRRGQTNGHANGTGTSQNGHISDEGEENNDENNARDATATPSSSRRKKRRRTEGGSVSGTPASVSSRRHRHDDGADEEQEAAEDDDDEEDPSQMQLNGDQPESSAAADSSLGNEEEEEAKQKKRRQRLIRDPADGYVMGSVVRIRCHNFITYSDIECTPGPHLNMIFGPNGSGKSSLAAAIAVGLGFPLKITGRTKELQNLVRERQTEGWIEIELKGKPGGRNTVVKRCLRSIDNKTTYTLNGKSVTQKEVTEAVQRLNVNVDNLCSFLPQDRVSAFSNMSGTELLRETQRVSNPKLIAQQEKLAELKEELMTDSTDLEKKQADLSDKDRKLASMERDVKRHKEKKRLEEKLVILENLLPYVQYSEEKAKHDDAKRARNDAKARLDTLMDTNAPLLQQKEILKDYLKACEKRRKEINKIKDTILRHGQKLHKDVEAKETSIENMRGKIKELNTVDEKRKASIAELESDIEKLVKRLEDEPPEADDADISARVRDVVGRLRAAHQDVLSNQAKSEEASEEINRIDNEKAKVAQDLTALQDVTKRRWAQCQREDVNLYVGSTYIRDQRRSFNNHVFYPIRLSVGIKDKRYTKLAEAAINYQVMKTVVCVDYNDYDRLGKIFVNYPEGVKDTGKDLRINIAQIPPERASMSRYNRPCSPEELNQWGFDAFVIDLIEGPEPVLAYLCMMHNLHQVPVAFDGGHRIRHDELRRPGTPFTKYIWGNTVTTVSFSKYGQKKSIVQDNPMKEPRIFAEMIDHARKRELDHKLAEIEAVREQKANERDQLIERDEELRKIWRPLKDERDALEEERNRIRAERAKFERARVTLRAKQDTLARYQNMPSEEANRKRLVRRMKAETEARLKRARELQSTGSLLLQCQAVDTTLVFSVIQGQSSAKAVETAYNDANEELAAVQAAYEEAQTRFTALKQSAKAIWNVAEAGKEQVPRHLYEEFSRRMGEINETSEQFSQKIADLQSELEMIQGVNPHIVRRYEDLKKDVERLRAELERQQEGARKAREEIDRLHSKWYPEVANIVKTVSENFAAAMGGMGCLGQVDIKEDDDYAKWEIKIFVSFRDNEEVSELTAQRQSGGERSLVTMLYLISLLELSKVPFSLVDEINQGMDQRAERAVHNQLVHAVCEKDDVGQYFLITPKLLTNLRYHERVKILCVNNGEWLPEQLPLKNIIARKLANRSNRQG